MGITICTNPPKITKPDNISLQMRANMPNPTSM